MTEQFLRQTAYKLWISDIIIAPFTQTQEQMTPNFITTRNLQISRVNIIGITTNIQKQENYSSIILDDSTAQINIRTWNEDTKLLDNILPGQIVIVIGKIRYFDNQGADINEVIENSKLIEQEAEKIIKELIKEGEIFEIKSGRLRTIT